MDFQTDHIEVLPEGFCRQHYQSFQLKPYLLLQDLQDNQDIIIQQNAIQNGTRAIYFTEEDFIAAYKVQKAMIKKILHSDLIVIDELFYLTLTNKNLVNLYKTVMFFIRNKKFYICNER